MLLHPAFFFSSHFGTICMFLIDIVKHGFILSQRFPDLSAETAQPDRSGLYSIAVVQPKLWHGSGLVGEQGASYSILAKLIHSNYMEGQNVNNVSVLQIFDTFGAHSLSLNLHILRPWKTSQDISISRENTGGHKE